ncbi:MAG: hypothetical protein SGI92_25040 [Bryobacteraceae bacterium]|nr:hypothetical protein [Bryobacteraceae bacterium]
MIEGIRMSVPLLPPPYDQLTQRSFSFYPALVGVEHNEWRLNKATWAEVQVLNTKSGEEIWIPRGFLGELSRTDEPVMIVGLSRELEFRMGQVVPHNRRVIEIPKAVNDFPRTGAGAPEPTLAHVVDIRLTSGAEGRVGRLILGALLALFGGCLLLLAFFRAERNPTVRYSAVLQSELGLSGQDDYFAVVRKLGDPGTDTWRSANGEMQYRVLGYPSRSVSVILMGSERNRVLYIGAVDEQWRPVHAVSLPGGRDTYSLLRTLRPLSKTNQ